MTFADRLRELRKEKGLTLEDVAQEISVQRANIYKYEHGLIKSVPPDKLHQLANLFGVTRPYLMGWTDERNANPDVNLDVVAEKLRGSDGGGASRQDVWKPLNTSDCTTAATQALRALAKFKVLRMPIYPQQILQASPLTTMMTYADPGEIGQVDNDLVTVTVRKAEDGKPHYTFAVNRNAPIGELSLMLCIHIGHIYLGHTENPKECSRRQEAECFALHLRYPRPLIRLLEERGFVFTKESFSRVFGYCDPCMESMLKAPPVRTSPELNRLVKDQFVPYVDMLEESGILRMDTHGEVMDFSRYMAGYEE